MNVRILTLRFDPTEGRFIDDAFVELNEAMEVVDCAHHFFESEGLPYLLMIARSAREASQRQRMRSNAFPKCGPYRYGL